jgi:hypothetical protein
VFNFHQHTLKALQELVQAAGLLHPNQIGPQHIVRRIDANDVRLLERLLPAVPAGALLGDTDLNTLPAVFRLYWPVASAVHFQQQVDLNMN